MNKRKLLLILAGVAITIIVAVGAVKAFQYYEKRNKQNLILSQLRTAVISNTKEVFDKAAKINSDAEAEIHSVESEALKCKNSEGKPDPSCLTKAFGNSVALKGETIGYYAKLYSLNQQTKVFFCDKSKTKFDELMKAIPDPQVIKNNWWSAEKATMRADLLAAMEEDKKSCNTNIDFNKFGPPPTKPTL